MTNATEDYNTFVRANLPSGMTYSNFRYWAYGKPFVSYKQAKWYLDYVTKMLYLNLPLNLDFTTGVLPSGLTFTRAGGGGRINSSGLFEWVGADVPRFDYDPVTLQPRGLLIEESRTNLLTYSGDLTNAAYAKNNVTVVADGDAFQLIPNTTSATHGLSASVTSTASSAHTLTVDVQTGYKRWFRLSFFNGTAFINVWFDLDNVAKGTNNADAGTSYIDHTITDLGGGWRRLRLSGIPATGGGTSFTWFTRLCQFDGDLGPWVGDGVSYNRIRRPQLEVGAFPTSYIPTTTAAATRAADICVMTGADFSRWFNPNEGTFYAEAATFDLSNNRGIYCVSNGTSQDELFGFVTTGGNALNPVRVANVVQADNLMVGAVAANAVFRMARAYKANDFIAAVNGTLSVADISGSLPVGMDRLAIGSRADDPNNGFPFNGHIRRLRYWPTRLSNAQLQELTT